MEITYRIICALCIISLRFPLYYLAPVDSISYIDVMNNDTNLCNKPIKQFLSKSEYTKECATLSYPRDIGKLTLKYETMETFLCLSVHDAIYKVCRYMTNKKWTNKFNKTEDLDLSIQNITGFRSTGEVSSQNAMVDEKNFCKVLSGYTPMYEKVRPALLELAKSLKDPLTCNKICIDINNKMNPLCLVLAWINRIDQTITNNVTATSNSEFALKNQENNNISDTHRHKETGNVSESVTMKPNDAVNQSNNEDKQKTGQDQESKSNTSQSPIGSKNNATIVASDEVLLSSVEKSHGKTNTTKTQFTVTTVTLQNDIPKPKKLLNEPDLQSHDNNQQHDNSPQQDDTMTNAEKMPKPDDTKVIADEENNANIEKNGNNKTLSSQTEEIKSTTLSENTQDNVVEDNGANNPNLEDFNRVEDDQLHSNLGDNLGQSMDADDRNIENSPKELGNIRVIKNDEESHFFTYFVITSLGFIGGYIAYHNKQKILAIVLEGRRSKSNRSRRRPSTANYRKLDCTLEEAVTSQCNANVTHVIY